MHQLTDLLVDDYFPPIYKHEDLLNDVEANTMDQSISELMEVIFDIRTEISKLRRTIIQMRDLLYRMISTSKILPLPFIAGVYGMNFQNMPELAGKYSYFIVLGVKILISISMLYAFGKMGWFRFHKGTKL